MELGVGLTYAQFHFLFLFFISIFQLDFFKLLAIGCQLLVFCAAYG